MSSTFPVMLYLTEYLLGLSVVCILIPTLNQVIPVYPAKMGKFSSNIGDEKMIIDILTAYEKYIGHIDTV